jgi:predicted HTH domain antitoxin
MMVPVKSLREIKFNIPTDIFLSVSLSEEKLINEMRTLVAFKYFSEGRLSSGKASELAQMSKVSFLIEASRMGIDILPYSDIELKRELACHDEDNL